MKPNAVILAVTLSTTDLVCAALIGPWPVGSTNMWEDQPITPTCGTVAIVATPAPFGTLNMSGFTSGTKSTWLPYSVNDATYSERMCIVQLIFDTNAPPATVHVKVYDPARSPGKSGWAVILKDRSGKILDFGIRGFFAPAQIGPHQFDGVSWNNGPMTDRARTGNSYYTMDFTKNADGTIGWSIAADENGSTWSSSNNTAIAYGDVVEVYLNVMTKDTTGAATYKWTEFSYTTAAGPSLPSLTAVRAGSDLSVSWVGTPGAFVVQSATTLVPSDWADMTLQPTIVVDGSTNTVALPIGTGNQFFRLRQ